MTLFDAPESNSSEEESEPSFPRRWRAQPLRVRVGQVLIVVAVLVMLGFAVSPAPFVIEQPGPVFNTLGVDTAIGQPAQAGAKPVLTIDDAKTYPTKGGLDLLTVNVVGNPDQLPSWAQVIWSWFFASKAVVPVNAEFPPGQSVQATNQQNAVDMSTSQQDATAAALTELGYKIPQQVGIASVTAGSASAGVLKAGDVVTSVDGTTVTSVDQLHSLVASNGTARAAKIGIRRAGKALSVDVTPRLTDGSAQLGIYVGPEYGAFPVNVGFQLADIGGPSAGQMFALGIIDKLTPGYLNGGKIVAGTGTIDGSGAVGAIGGIRQKMYGAKAAGATVFLAPASNCSDVVGHVPSGLQVFAVSTLKDSLAVLKVVSTGASTASLPTCTTATQP